MLIVPAGAAAAADEDDDDDDAAATEDEDEEATEAEDEDEKLWLKKNCLFENSICANANWLLKAVAIKATSIAQTVSEGVRASLEQRCFAARGAVDMASNPPRWSRPASGTPRQ